MELTVLNHVQQVNFYIYRQVSANAHQLWIGMDKYVYLVQMEKYSPITQNNVIALNH